MIPIRWPDAALLSPLSWSPDRRVRWGALSALVVVALVAGSGMAKAGRNFITGRTPKHARAAATALHPAVRPATRVLAIPLRAPAPRSGPAVAAVAPAAPVPASASASASTDRPAAPATARIGAIFAGGSGMDDHHCTGSVIGPDLIVTAAHCSTDGSRFSPGFHNGRNPYGMWRLGDRMVDGAWNSDHDEDHDIAFVWVKPLGGRHIGDVVGYNAIRFDPGFGLRVTVTGYPSGGLASVSGSDRTARYSDHQMRITVPGMAGGTSGGPWITSGGEVVGVIGGHDEGGSADDVSYSVYFDASVRDLYDSVVTDARRTH